MFEAPENTARHMVQVLRLRIGDSVLLFNGNNTEYSAVISELKKKTVVLNVIGENVVSRESSIQIHLIQAISKGDRMDWVVQKAVELGVSSIRPVISKRNNVNLSGDRMDKKTQHWAGIISSACEQCGRNQLPLLHDIKPLEASVVESDLQSSCHKIMLDPLGKHNLKNDIAGISSFAVAIGPEGGFDEIETKFLVDNGFTSYNFGPRIFRTETAAIACLSVLQAIAGDL